MSGWRISDYFVCIEGKKHHLIAQKKLRHESALD